MGFFEKNSARMQSVIDDIISRQAHGISVDYDALADLYPDLMPELADRIRRIRAIESAAIQTRIDTDSDTADVAQSNPQADYVQRFSPRYEVLDPISYGAQGIVYKAVQRSTKRTVAIKFLMDGPLANPRQRRRFKRETELVSRLRHPNIVSVYEAGEIEGRPYVVMEYIDGLAIDDYITVEQVSLRDTMTIFEKVCSAVSTAHQNGIIHRDLKPSNILVDFDGQPHVLDFGLAKETRESDDTTEISLPDQLIGTLPYLSPEQVRGKHIDTRSDVYALGVILYELIVGDRPYPIEVDRAAALQAILHADPKPPRKALKSNGEKKPWRSSDIGKDLEQIVLKTLRKTAESRYQSADTLAEDIRKFLSGDAVSARADSAWYTLRKTARRYRIHSTIAGAFLILLLSSLAIMAHLWRQAETIALQAVLAANAGALIKLGGVERDGGRIEQAIDAYKEAIRLTKLLNSNNPVLRVQTFNANHRLAALLLSEKRIEEAIPYAEEAVRLGNDLFPGKTASPESREALGGAWRMKGRVEFGLNRYSDAAVCFSRAIEIQERLVQEHPDNVGLQVNLANSLTFRAWSYRMFDSMTDSFRDYQRSYEIYQRLSQDDPENVSRSLDFARAESRLGIWHMDQRSPELDKLALDWFDRASARLEQTRQLPNSEDRVYDLDTLSDEINHNRAIIEKRMRKRAALVEPVTARNEAP